MRKNLHYALNFRNLSLVFWLTEFGQSWAGSQDPVLIGKWPAYWRASGDYAKAIAVSGNYAYLPAGDLQIFDLTDLRVLRKIT